MGARGGRDGDVECHRRCRVTGSEMGAPPPISLTCLPAGFAIFLMDIWNICPEGGGASSHPSLVWSATEIGNDSHSHLECAGISRLSTDPSISVDNFGCSQTLSDALRSIGPPLRHCHPHGHPAGP